MNRQRYIERQRGWDQFEKWESRHKTVEPFSKKLKRVGGWVDFILSRSAMPRGAPDVRGIEKLCRCLSSIRCAR